jgi:hypothetical protein
MPVMIVFPFDLILARRACASAMMRTTEAATLAGLFGSVPMTLAGRPLDQDCGRTACRLM